MSENERPAAVQVAKEERGRIAPGDVITLSSGYRARLRPVSSRLVNAVQAKVPRPDPPMQMIEEKGREEPNYQHPEYQRALEEWEEARAEAISDVVIIFGVELVDGVPDLEEWLPKLRYLERLGRISLDEYDMDDPDELEFVFKKFIAVNAPDMRLVGRLGTVRPEEVALAAEGFRREEARDPD